MAKYGIIYIANNPQQGDNVFKVGMTSRSIEERIRSFNSETGTLGVFRAWAYFVVDDIEAAEKLCHKRLDNYRVQGNREFFKIDFTLLYAIVRQSVSAYKASHYVSTTIDLELSLEEELNSLNEGNEDVELKSEPKPDPEPDVESDPSRPECRSKPESNGWFLWLLFIAGGVALFLLQ